MAGRDENTRPRPGSGAASAATRGNHGEIDMRGLQLLLTWGSRLKHHAVTPTLGCLYHRRVHAAVGGTSAFGSFFRPGSSSVGCL